MGLLRRIARVSVPAGLSFLAAACTLAPAKIWNLEQLHESDGTPRRRGNLHGDFEYLLTQAFRKTNFGGPEFQARQRDEKRIKDPLGKCFDNVLALSEARRDERVAGLQAWAFAWLAVDCTYVLSRERCALELGSLARDLSVPAAAPPPEGEPSTPEALKPHFDRLLEVVRGVQAAPGLAGSSLSEVCAGIRALPLDRAGALRLLRVANHLLENGEGQPHLQALRELRNVLAQRCVILALRAALTDPQGRVRAAALESAVRAFPSERAALLRWGVTDEMQGVEERGLVALRALQLVARSGLPTPPEGVSAADFARTWEELLVQVLRLSLEGPHSAAACQALAKITGAPLTLRPEVWIARWQASVPRKERGVPSGRAAPSGGAGAASEQGARRPGALR